MDAGLGIKAYAVIEQGKIGQILSARPTDRRQLIEEAAGVTKYKSRRRAAELKLEAAQQNLTRVDDIVFEVEKQRGALKRQAAKARRYRRLREELRRWEKVQFAQRYRAARGGHRVGADAARRCPGPGDRRRRAPRRSRGHARAPAPGADGGRQPDDSRPRGRARQRARDRPPRSSRLRSTSSRSSRWLPPPRTSRRKSARSRRGASRRGWSSKPAAPPAPRRRRAARRPPTRSAPRKRRTRRSSATSKGSRPTSKRRGAKCLPRSTPRRPSGTPWSMRRPRARGWPSRLASSKSRAATCGSSPSGPPRMAPRPPNPCSARAKRWRWLRVDRAAKESELAGARADRDGRAQELRTRERDLAGITGRLESLEEMDAGRAEYGDGARLILAESQGEVAQMGSVADYLEVEVRHERAVEACLGDLLQHVVVQTHAQAAAGLQFARERNAGRVGFLIAEGSPAVYVGPAPGADVTPLSDLVRVSGPAAGAIRAAISKAWIAGSYEAARDAAARTSAPVATLDGEVFRGAHVVEGGARAEARGILGTKREIKELRERADADRVTVDRLRDDISALDVAMAALESAILSLQGELHRLEKAVVGFELQASAAGDAVDRISRKQDQISTERRSAQEELRVQEARQDEARESIARIAGEQRTADDQLNTAQRRLFEAREDVHAQARRTSEAKASHAALVERAGALALEVQRLEEAAQELETRVSTPAGRSPSHAGAALGPARDDHGLGSQARRRRAHVRGPPRSGPDRRRGVAGAPRRLRGTGRAHPGVAALARGRQGRGRSARRDARHRRSRSHAPGHLLLRLRPGDARRGRGRSRRARGSGDPREPEAGGRCARGGRSRGRARRGGGRHDACACRRAHDDARRDGRRPPDEDRGAWAPST